MPTFDEFLDALQAKESEVHAYMIGQIKPNIVTAENIPSEVMEYGKVLYDNAIDAATRTCIAHLRLYHDWLSSFLNDRL